MVPDTLALALYKQTVDNLDEVLTILGESIVTDQEIINARKILFDTRDAYQVLIKHIEIGKEEGG